MTLSDELSFMLAYERYCGRGNGAAEADDVSPDLRTHRL